MSQALVPSPPSTKPAPWRLPVGHTRIHRPQLYVLQRRLHELCDVHSKRPFNYMCSYSNHGTSTDFNIRVYCDHNNVLWMVYMRHGGCGFTTMSVVRSLKKLLATWEIDDPKHVLRTPPTPPLRHSGTL